MRLKSVWFVDPAVVKRADRSRRKTTFAAGIRHPTILFHAKDVVALCFRPARHSLTTFLNCQAISITASACWPVDPDNPQQD
jgi:hypothetical protein